MDFVTKLCGIDVSVHVGHVLLKSDWKFPVGAGPLAMPEVLRIFRETPSIPNLSLRPPDSDGTSLRRCRMPGLAERDAAP